MPLQTKLSSIEVDPTGTTIKINETTGAYSSTNLTGYGGPNTPTSSIEKIIFTVSRYKSEEVSSVVFVRNFDPDNIDYIINPSIEQITNGDPIVLNSILLGITKPEEGIIPFRDSVYDINEYSLTSEVSGVVGIIGNPFITGNTMTDIINNYDAVLIGNTMYDIDKSKPDNGGTVLYLTEELEESTSVFQPAYRANTKVLVDSQSQYGIRYLSSKIYRGECNGQADLYKEKAYEAIVHTVAARDSMYCASFEEADWNVNEAYRIVKSKF